MDLKETLDNIATSLSDNINEICKGYASEKITLDKKKEFIESAVNVAKIRIGKALDCYFTKLNTILVDQVDPDILESINDIRYDEITQ